MQEVPGSWRGELIEVAVVHYPLRFFGFFCGFCNMVETRRDCLKRYIDEDSAVNRLWFNLNNIRFWSSVASFCEL